HRAGGGRRAVHRRAGAWRTTAIRIGQPAYLWRDRVRKPVHLAEQTAAPASAAAGAVGLHERPRPGDGGARRAARSALAGRPSARRAVRGGVLRRGAHGGGLPVVVCGRGTRQRRRGRLVYRRGARGRLATVGWRAGRTDIVAPVAGRGLRAGLGFHPGLAAGRGIAHMTHGLRQDRRWKRPVRQAWRPRYSSLYMMVVESTRCPATSRQNSGMTPARW